MERPWIKSVIVINTDSSEEPFELINGLEALPENEIRDNISTSKMDILKYTSSYYYWDVDNIIVNGHWRTEHNCFINPSIYPIF